MYDLLSIGDCTWDTFLSIEKATLLYGKKSHRPEQLCLPYGEKIAIEESFDSMGGNAANVAVGIQRLGFRSAIAGEVGNDLHASQILSELKKDKIDTKYLKKNKQRKTRFSTVLNFKGERTILSYFEKVSYNKITLPATKNIYYTSLGYSFENIQKKLISYLKAHPKTQLICNPGSYELKEKKNVFAKILPLTSVLFVNKEEAEILVGSAPSTKALLHKLHQTGSKVVVITDGVLGSSASDGQHSLSCGIYNVPIVSKTGAGDAYASGFIAGFMKDLSLAECMMWGTANAASVTGHLGAQTGLLTEPQLKKFMGKHPVPQALHS